MKHNIKLVQGSEDSLQEMASVGKKISTSLTINLTKKQLTQMKGLSGLKGAVTNDQIIKEYLKAKMTYGY
jgi:hypothetical protein|tara:strand:+ start:227 stop:436 length:210 start_codon:yes stop_codon:yes gene_type:complete